MLTGGDKTSITNGDKRIDKHINFAQQLLKMQFPGLSMNGLRSTLLQMKKQPLSDSKQVVQIVHSCGDHWLALSTVSAVDGEVNIYVSNIGQGYNTSYTYSASNNYTSSPASDGSDTKTAADCAGVCYSYHYISP